MNKLKNRKAFDPIYSFIFNTIWLIIFISILYLITKINNEIIIFIGFVFLMSWLFFGIASYCLELDKRDREIKNEKYTI